MNSKQQPTDSRIFGDLILPFVIGPIPFAMSDIRSPIAGEPPMSTLIYSDAAGCAKLIAKGVADLGRNSIIVHTLLDAILRLQDVAMTIDAVFVSLEDSDFDISAFFDFLKEEHPHVRRIAFARHSVNDVRSERTRACQHDMILWDPWDRTDFSEILKDALDCRVHLTRSSWSDLELFESSQGADSLAIAEIVKRYRHRIVHLVMDRTNNTPDIEDIVQNTYLAILRFLPSFGGVCAPGRWIDGITSMCIRSSLPVSIPYRKFHGAQLMV